MATQLGLIPATAPLSARINGKDLRNFGVELVPPYPSIVMPSIRQRQQIIEGKIGARDHGSIYGPTDFNLSFHIRGTDHNNYVDKRDALLQWIQLPQNISEFVVGQTSVKALKFELAGHKYVYSTGTVSITTGTNTVTGVGTKWKSYVMPGARVIFASDTTIYKVDYVVSDTVIRLTTNKSGTLTAGTYEVSTNRYLLVNYNGASDIGTIGPAHFTYSIYKLGVGFIAVYPYWIGDIFSQEFDDLDGTTRIKTIEGLGNVPTNPIYYIVGASTNPIITAAKYAFLEHFDSFNSQGQPNKTRGILNDSDITPPASPNGFRVYIRYRAGKIGSGAVGLFGRPDRQRGDLLSFPTSTLISTTSGTLSFWFKPFWSSNDSTRHHVLFCNGDITSDANKKFVVYWNKDNKRFEFWYAGTTATQLRAHTGTQTFNANDWLCITVNWDTGTTLQQIRMNGTLGTSVNQTNEAITLGADTTSYIGVDKASMFSADGWVDDMFLRNSGTSAAGNTNHTDHYNTGSGRAGNTALFFSGTLLFYEDFDGTVDASLGASFTSDTGAATVTVTAMGLGYHYLPGAIGKGILLDGGDSLGYGTANTWGRKDAMSFAVWVRPNFNADDAWFKTTTGDDNPILFHWEIDASSYYQVFYDITNDKWVFRKVDAVGGTQDASSATQYFQRDDLILIAGTFDSSLSSAAMKIYVNGSNTGATNNNNTANLDGHPSTLFIGGSRLGASNEVNRQLHGIIEEFALFVRPLDADEIMAIYTDREALTNSNTTLKFTGTISDGSVLTSDVEAQTHKLLNPSTIAETDAYSNITGDIPSLPAETDGKVIVYVPQSVKKLRVTYRPHWI